MPLFGKEHIERYEATGGQEGYHWENGTTILLLHTTGRKSGRDITSPLIFREIDGKYVIVASKGGDPKSPDWYLNIQQDPNVRIQVQDETFDVTAHTASAEEKAPLWSKMTEVWPDYDNYQTKTDREIPVVVLERA